jgi:peptide/nickel transport system substrate-binding protein
MTTRLVKALGAFALAGLLVGAAACGGDDADDGASTTAGGATTAAGSSETTAPAAELTSVTIAETLAPPTLDITTGSGAAIPQALLYNVYETLVKIDDTGEFQPLLAESYEISDDGLTYTFALRPDLTFSSGEALTAEDVVFSFERARTLEEAPGIIKETFRPVASVEAPDDQTVVITLSQPSRNFLFNLSQTGGVVINEAAVADLATKADGSGPYTVAEFVSNDRLGLALNASYWGEQPAVPEVTFRYFADPNAQVAALKSGDVQILDNITAELFGELEASGDFQTEQGVTDGETIISINNSRAPLDDERVRQALSYAIDKEAMNLAAASGLGYVIGSHASKNDPWFTDLAGTYPYDPEKAKELLADAGQEDLELTMIVPPTPYASAISQLAVSQLADVGVTLTLEQVDFPKWIDQVFLNADYDLSVISHVEARDINQYGNPEYYWRYDDAETQDLLAQAEAEPDEAASNELYTQVQERISDQSVNVFLYLLPRLQVVQEGITGYPKNTYSLAYDVTQLRAG